MSLMTPAELQSIAAAITAAERETSGEIVAVVAAESSTYLYAPFLCAAVAALLVPWPLIYFTWWSLQWIYLVQLCVFLIVLALTFPRSIRPWLVPGFIKQRRAHRRAGEVFLSQNLHTTAGRTGVLIFVSVAERYVEIIADSGIEERVPAGTWQAIVDRMTQSIGEGRVAEGFVEAIKAAGVHLAKHFPPGTSSTNELPNHLIVLE